MLGHALADDEWSAYENDSHDMYINILLDNLNKLYFRVGKINFMYEYGRKQHEPYPPY